MGKFMIGFIAAMILSALLGIAYFAGTQNQVITNPSSAVSPTPVDSSSAVTPASSSNATPMASIGTGTVTGRLCYPSSFLPAGKIVAKDITTDKIVSQEYAGSDKGGKSTFAFELLPGKYNLRYEADNGSNTLYGYHTTVCKTGSETTCGDTKQRELINASVETGKTVDNFDLCDFYYQPSNTPKF